MDIISGLSRRQVITELTAIERSNYRQAVRDLKVILKDLFCDELKELLSFFNSLGVVPAIDKLLAEIREAVESELDQRISEGAVQKTKRALKRGTVRLVDWAKTAEGQEVIGVACVGVVGVLLGVNTFKD